MANPDQLKRLHAEGAKCGLSHDDLHNYALNHFGVDSLTKLSNSHLTQMFLAIKKAQKVRSRKRVSDRETGRPANMKQHQDVTHPEYAQESGRSVGDSANGNPNPSHARQQAAPRGPRLESLQDIETLLRELWPALEQATEDCGYVNQEYGNGYVCAWGGLHGVINDVRFNTRSEAISKKRVAKEIERLKHYPRETIIAASRVWFEMYRTQPDLRYYVGICRQTAKKQFAEGKRAENKDELEIEGARMQAERSEKGRRAQRQVDRWLAALGFQHGNQPAQICHNCNNSGEFKTTQPPANQPIKLICPYCARGRLEALRLCLRGRDIVVFFPPELYGFVKSAIANPQSAMPLGERIRQAVHCVPRPR